MQRAWKEAGGASAAMRSKGGANGRGPPDWTATILESLARRLSSPCSLVAPRTPTPPRSEITSRGGRYFKYRPPLGLLEPLDQTRASPMGRGLRQGLSRPPQAGLGRRERDAALPGLVGEGPPAIEDPRNLALAAGKLREVRAARHVAAAPSSGHP